MMIRLGKKKQQQQQKKKTREKPNWGWHSPTPSPIKNDKIYFFLCITNKRGTTCKNPSA